MKTSKIKIYLALFVSILFISAGSKANTMYFQTIRGRVIDQDSKTPIIGAAIIIIGSEPVKGSTTDFDGNFRLDQVPVGRVDLQISYLGYEKKNVSNLVIGSGKEVVITIELTELVMKLEDITILAQKNKEESLNEMATVSAKVFTVEETKRYAGTFNDPARMVASFAGVTANAEGNNDIIVRGNSPRGILWKLEGVEIPNPNHFANEGSSGGPINALNSAMLSNSDFYTSAFAPEYGNAFSGVFDMKLRTGNNEKHEQAFSAGALGIDFTTEGPFKKGYSGSYLMNYRYSSLGILDDLGLVDFYGVPKYQDLSFNIVLPAGKIGKFSVFGLGGKSNIAQKTFSDETETFITRKADWMAELGVLGLNYTIPLNDNAYLKNTLSVSAAKNGGTYSQRDSTEQLYDADIENFVNTAVRISSMYNHKFNSQHRIKMGIIYSDLGFNFQSKYDLTGTENYTIMHDAKGRAGLLQAFVNWKYRLHDDLTFITGIHYMEFLLNKSTSIEPRIGLEYVVAPGKLLSFGFGSHSKVENIATYFSKVSNEDGSYKTPNTDLGFTGSMHFVIGYKQQLTEFMYIKTEAYYQQLYNVAVENNMNSPIVLNNQQGGWSNTELVNKGQGRNYGLELTLERFYHHNFYFLFTGSLYDSKFTALNGIEQNSAFNGKFASNFLIGKEFKVGDRAKNRFIGLNAKVIYYGGNPYTPIDLQASIESNNGEYDMSKYLTSKGDNVFKADMSVTYRRERLKTTHEFKIDIQNVTNNQAKVYEYYNPDKKSIEASYQWSIFPNVIYTIQF